MRRPFKWDKQYLYWGITAFCVIAASIFFYMALRYLPDIGKWIGGVIGILSPFIWGLVISYLLMPVMRAMEKNIFLPLSQRVFKKSKKHTGKKLSRGLSVFMAIVIFLAVIAALVYLILPQLYSSIDTIVKNSPTYIDNLGKWAEQLLQDYPEIEQYVLTTLDRFNENIMDWLEKTVLPELGSMLTNLTAGVYYALKGVYNLIIGIIVSVYILGNIEGFGASARRLMYSLFSIEKAEKLREGVAFIDKTFMGFINGKLLDSAIIGLICYIVCAILNMPYALLVSVIVGVTNIIPFFGPFIGAVPSAIIILMVSPMKCLIFVILIIVLQQVDGNIIGPKILGSSIGINGFWVMFSIILGAGLFGFWGMLLGVPVFVVIYTGINSLIVKKLKSDDLPVDMAEYNNLDHIDPITRQAVKKPGDEDTEGTK